MLKFFALSSLVFLIGSPLLITEELSLHILDSSEAAVPGAIVEIRSSAPTRQVFSTVTDGQGRVKASVWLPITVQVKAPGFEPLNQKIDKSTVEQTTLHLMPAILHTTIEVMVQENPASEESVERSALVIDRSGARTVYEAVDKLIPSAYVPDRGVLGHGLGTPPMRWLYAAWGDHPRLSCWLWLMGVRMLWV